MAKRASKLNLQMITNISVEYSILPLFTVVRLFLTSCLKLSSLRMTSLILFSLLIQQISKRLSELPVLY